MNNYKKIAEYLAVKRFLQEHPDYFTKDEQSLIDYYSSKNNDDGYLKDVTREIYDELGLIPEDKNIYIAFIELIRQVFGLDDKNIVEVGGGIIPRLAKRIKLQQKNGTITVYDPRLAKDIDDTEGMTLKREQFSSATEIPEANLLIGLMPCEGATPLIMQATQKQIDFILWLCEGGPHGEPFDFYESDEEWLDSTIHTARRGVEDNNMGELHKLELKDYSDYPIIYNQRKK